MLPATNDRVEKWKKKYGSELLNHFEEVRLGKITIQELAVKMKVTKECARKYFHRYYSEADLIGTRFFKQKTTLKQPVKAVSTGNSENQTTLGLHNEQLKSIVKEVVAVEMNSLLASLTTLKQQLETTILEALKNHDNLLTTKSYVRPSFLKEEAEEPYEVVIPTGVNIENYGD